MHLCASCGSDCDCDGTASHCEHLCMPTFPKPRPRLLEKRAAKAALNSLDKAERKKCRMRSGGRCEVLEVKMRPEESAVVVVRCKSRASQNHHLLAGRGRRNIGESVLAGRRIDVCGSCHMEITNHVLTPVTGDRYTYAASVRYWRLK